MGKGCFLQLAHLRVFQSYFLWKGLHVYFHIYPNCSIQAIRKNTEGGTLLLCPWNTGSSRKAATIAVATTGRYWELLLNRAYKTTNQKIIVCGDFDLKRLIKRIKIYDDGLRIAEGCKEGNLCMCPSEQLHKKLMDFHQYISLCKMCVHFHIICIWFVSVSVNMFAQVNFGSKFI